MLFEKERRLIHRVENAIGLIEMYDPLKYRRMQQDIDKIWVDSTPGACGSYDGDRRLIVLDSHFATEVSDEEIASVIVHEATHARLRKFGYKEGLRSRIERCCIRREIAFARKHPSGDGITEPLAEALSYSEEFYSNLDANVRARAWELEEARRLGLPEGLVRFAHRLRDRRSRTAMIRSRRPRPVTPR